MNTSSFLALFMAMLAGNGFSNEIPIDEPRGADDLNGTFVFFNPFAIHIDPMERLLLVNFEKDSDSVYVGFEPQVFDDEVNGTGHLVIGWRADGRVDVYHQPGLRIQPEKYDIAGKGLFKLVETEMQGAYFEVNDFGVQAYYSFTDYYGRQVEIAISETNPRKRKPFGLLAPMGYAAENPSAMPLVLLHDFYFVRRKLSQVTIRIGERQHKPDLLPIRMDRSKMTFTRYSPEPLIATLNPAFDGILQPLRLTSGSNSIGEGTELIMVETNDGPAIGHLGRTHLHHKLLMAFDPPFPCPTSIDAGQRFEGRFTLKGDPTTGEVAGIYRIENVGGKVKILLHPSGGWIQRPDRFSLRFLYRVGKVFKNWPKAYQWHASLVQKDGTFVMKSEWKKDAN